MEKVIITRFVKPDGATEEILIDQTNIKDTNLKDLPLLGFGIHHAGLLKKIKIWVLR
jgi:pre-mRNA-splicing helicase BRR2